MVIPKTLVNTFDLLLLAVIFHKLLKPVLAMLDAGGQEKDAGASNVQVEGVPVSLNRC
jgi:hypothetical protein